MRNFIFKTGVLLILSAVLSSCAGGSYSPGNYETSGEVSRAAGGVNDDRMITYTVNIQISVDNVDETRKLITEQINNYSGYITRESDNQITARIPVEYMDEYLNRIRTFGKVENESKTGVDITDQYRDNVIRLDSLRNIRGRYLELLQMAETIGDILSIEKELERVNTEIEIMEGRIKSAQMSVAYSSITVRFNEKVRPGPIGWLFYGLYVSLKWLFVLN